MMQTGHALTRIAFNEHRTAPALSARARRSPEAFGAEARKNQTAAKRARQKAASKPSKPPTRKAPRFRRQVRDLMSDIRRAKARDDFKAVHRLADALGRLLAKRPGGTP